MYLFELKYWWTFQEVFQAITGSDDDNPWTELNNYDLADFMDSTTYAAIFSDTARATHFSNLFNLLYRNHFDDYVFFTDEDDITEDSENTKLNRFISKIATIMINTYPKYVSLLNYYSTYDGDLMNKIASVSSGVAKFNDTPQNNDDNFEDDDHVTNITQTEGTSSTDGMPLMERLKQIQESYRNLMWDWSREFRGLFIDEENITL